MLYTNYVCEGYFDNAIRLLAYYHCLLHCYYHYILLLLSLSIVLLLLLLRKIFLHINMWIINLDEMNDKQLHYE